MPKQPIGSSMNTAIHRCPLYPVSFPFRRKGYLVQCEHSLNKDELRCQGQSTSQPRPQGFSLKKWEGKSPGDEVVNERTLQWRIQRRGPTPPLFFDQNEATKFFGNRALPLSQGLDDRPPLSQGLDDRPHFISGSG